MENLDIEFFQEEQFWGSVDRSIQELETLIGVNNVNSNLDVALVSQVINHLKSVTGCTPKEM